MDEKIRQDKISKMSLTLNAQSTFFTVTAVLLALIAFIWTSGQYETTKGFWTLILVIVAIGLEYKQLKTYQQIDELFPDLKKK